MACFDDIPEDKHESYPCPDCEGNIVQNKEGFWHCDSCAWNTDTEVTSSPDEETFACPIRYKPFIEFCIKYNLSSKDGVEEWDTLVAKCNDLYRELNELKKKHD